MPAHKMGFLEATTSNGLNLLKKNNMLILFPEGEYGNFKPSQKRYRLQEFKRGFVRMAVLYDLLTTSVPAPVEQALEVA